MDNGKADILAGIRELRAKAAAQLSGNEYYIIVQQLDSLANSTDLSDEAAHAVFNLISARLSSGATVAASAGAGGDPEIPETPDTPAQPDPPSTPEQPVVPDSPAQPDGSPGPDIPAPPSSPAQPPSAPTEIPSTAPSAAVSEEPIQIVAPNANSFGTPQATVAVGLAIDPEPASPAVQPAGGLAAAAVAMRTLVQEELTGNRYYAAANLLGQLEILPPAAGASEITPPADLDGAVELLRREAARLSGVAQNEAGKAIAALEAVLKPQEAAPAKQPESAAPPPDVAAEAPSPEVEPEPAAEPPLSTEAAEEAEPEQAAPTFAEAAEAPEAEPEPEPEPRTGFDDLADAAWRRVQEVSAVDARPPISLNGSAAPASVPEPKAEEPVTAPAAPGEQAAQEIAEAFDDGGSESRSSEPCYLHEFDLAVPQPAADHHQEPAAEAVADAAPETERETVIPAEAETVIATAAAPEQPAPEAAPDQPQQDAAAIAPEPGETEIAAADSAEVTQEAVSEPPASEAPVLAEPDAVAATAAEAPAAEVQKAEPVAEAAPEPVKAEDKPAAPETAKEPAAKPTRRGFFGRLFGASSAEHR